MTTEPAHAVRRWASCRQFMRMLVSANPRALAVVIVVQLLSSATQVVGLLLLIPLLGVAHVGHFSTTGGIVHAWRSVFHFLHIPTSLPATLIVYVGLVAVVALLNAYASVRVTRYRLELIDGFRGRLYESLAAADWRHMLSVRQSDLLNILTVNVSWVASAVVSVLTLQTTILLAVVQLLVAFRISAPITGLALLTGLVLTVAVTPLARRSRVLGGQLMEGNRALLGSVTDFFSGLKLAKAHGRESTHVTAFVDRMARSRQAQIDFARVSATATAVQTVLGVAALAVLVDVAVQNEQVGTSALLVLLFIFSRLVGQISPIQRNVMQVAQALPAFDELASSIDAAGARRESLAVTSGQLALRDRLSIEGVSFAYQSGGQVLTDVSFVIEAQQTVALVGPSGAGKTTLADLVVGLLRADSGRILVDGEPVSDRLQAWRASIALVPQEPFLFHETVRANLSWATPDASEPAMWMALETAAAKAFVSRLPQGLDTVVGDRGVRLSGGERQRIALARALLRAPSLLILDEATSSLDTENELAIRSALGRLHGTLSMLVIAHRLSTIATADVIVVMDAGRVLEVGPWDELSVREQGRLKALIDAGAT